MNKKQSNIQNLRDRIEDMLWAFHDAPNPMENNKVEKYVDKILELISKHKENEWSDDYQKAYRQLLKDLHKPAQPNQDKATPAEIESYLKKNWPEVIPLLYATENNPCQPGGIIRVEDTHPKYIAGYMEGYRNAQFNEKRLREVEPVKEPECICDKKSISGDPRLVSLCPGCPKVEPTKPKIEKLTFQNNDNAHISLDVKVVANKINEVVQRLNDWEGQK